MHLTLGVITYWSLECRSKLVSFLNETHFINNLTAPFLWTCLLLRQLCLSWACVKIFRLTVVTWMNNQSYWCIGIQIVAEWYWDWKIWNGKSTLAAFLKLFNIFCRGVVNATMELARKIHIEHLKRNNVCIVMIDIVIGSSYMRFLYVSRGYNYMIYLWKNATFSSRFDCRNILNSVVMWYYASIKEV